jgi:hypothetical protein
LDLKGGNTMKGIRKSLIALVTITILLGIGYLVYAQTPDAPAVATMKGVGYGDPFAYESITVTGTAKVLTAGTYTTDAKKAFISIESASVRWRVDGTAPTISEGHLSYPAQTITLNGYAQIARFQVILATATSATIKITYLK